jgi:hypothetical protein
MLFYIFLDYYITKPHLGKGKVYDLIQDWFSGPATTTLEGIINLIIISCFILLIFVLVFGFFQQYWEFFFIATNILFTSWYFYVSYVSIFKYLMALI